MKERKLFYALLLNGEKIKVEKVINKKEKFFCPHCRERVVPKMGDNKQWHFSHLNSKCGSLKKDDLSRIKSLDNFKTKEEATFTAADLDTFFCPFCKAVSRKENGVKVSESKHVCKNCFRNLPADRINEIL